MEYTELIFGATLKEDTPIEVIETLRYFIGDIEKPKTLAFEESRNPLKGGSFYFGVSTSVSKMWLETMTKQWIVSTRSNLKNRDNNIEKFLEWVKPYIERGSGDKGVFAFTISENQAEPNIHYLDDEEYHETDLKKLRADGFVSGSCQGEVCSVCGKNATNKLEETIFWDDPNKMRHPLTAYVCRKHFRMIVGGIG